MRRPSRWLLGFCFLLTLNGCAIFGGSPPREGGSNLSTAAREAKKDEKEKQKVLVAGEKEREPAPEVVVVVEEDEESLAPEMEGGGPDLQLSGGPAAPGGFPFHVGIVAGGGTLASDQLDGFGGGGLQLGGYLDPRLRVDFQVLGMSVNLAERSRLEGSIKDEFELMGDLSARWYLTPENTFLGLYPMGGFRFGTLMWDYANPIAVAEDGEIRSIADDEIYFYEPYVGLGVSLAQTRHLHVGVNLTSGLRFYDRHTQQGFRNDEFGTESYHQLMVELTGIF